MQNSSLHQEPLNVLLNVLTMSATKTSFLNSLQHTYKGINYISSHFHMSPSGPCDCSVHEQHTS